jgi:hypothetical protein
MAITAIDGQYYDQKITLKNLPEKSYSNTKKVYIQKITVL